jgi:cell division septal protein FtsQ
MSLDAGQPRKRWTLMPLLRGAHVLLRVMAVAVVVVAGGFFWFLAQLESDEAQPKWPTATASGW